jgi:hypothetical protein
MAIINFLMWAILILNAIIVAGIAIACVWAYGGLLIRSISSIYLECKNQKHIK